LSLKIEEWFLIGLAVFIGLTLNSVKKTFTIYSRQKNYPTVKEAALSH